MAIRKKDRNKEIVKLRNEQGWTFNRIGEFFNIDRRTARDIYYREMEKFPEEYGKMKMKLGYTQSRLYSRP
jgi:hypothetical protein